MTIAYSHLIDENKSGGYHVIRFILVNCDIIFSGKDGPDGYAPRSLGRT